MPFLARNFKHIQYYYNFLQWRHLASSYTTIQANLIISTVFYNIIQYFLKYELGPKTSKIGRGVCQNLFFFDRTPPLPPPYCAIALLSSTITLGLSRHLHTALPTHRFFITFFWTLLLGLHILRWQETVIIRLIYTNVSSWLSRHINATTTIFILYLHKKLSIPVVLLAVHSSCTSRCPQTILIQEKTIFFIVMTPANHLD